MTWDDVGGIVIAVLFFAFLVVGVPMLKERRAGLATVSNVSGYALPWMVRYLQPSPAPHRKKVMSTRQKRTELKRHKTRLKQRKARSIPAYQSVIPGSAIPQTTAPQLDINTKELTDKKIAVVRKMLTTGFSSNEIFTVLGGDRATRLAQIKAIKEQIDEEKRVAAAAALAKEIAQPQLDVPPMELPVLPASVMKFDPEPVELA